VISDALNMHSVSKLFDKKGQLDGKLSMLEMTLCFAENVPDGIQEILKTQILSALSQLFRLMCKQKSRILGGNHIVEEELDFETAAFEPKNSTK
jgi:hypothetical protein